MNTVSREAGKRRPYRMKARAEAAAETGQRILEAVIELYNERFHDQITLDDIAERAGVTVQTVLRRFGSRDELLKTTAEWVQGRATQQRGEAPAGNIFGAVDNIVAHYEEIGEGTLRLLAQEERVPSSSLFWNKDGGDITGGWRRPSTLFLKQPLRPTGSGPSSSH